MTADIKAWIEERRAIHRDGWTGEWSWSLNDTDLATLRATGGHVDFDLIRDDEFRGPSEVLDEMVDAHNITVPTALSMIEAMLDLHEPVQDDGDDHSYCHLCGYWPCDTYRALEGVIDSEST